MCTLFRVKEWSIIRILKNVLLVLYYVVPVYLSFEVINEWLVDIQESLTRESDYLTWAPTGFSYIILSATILVPHLETLIVFSERERSFLQRSELTTILEWRRKTAPSDSG